MLSFLLLVIGLWVINKKLPSGSKRLTVDIGLLLVVGTIAAALVVVIIQSKAVRDNPLLTGVAALSLITAVASFTDSFVTIKFRKDLELIAARLRAQVAGLGNLMFYSTKDEAFKNLSAMTLQAKEKIMATRFSPADISTESEYWFAIKQRAMDQSVLSVRIHSLAHRSSSCIDGVCKVIREFRGAKQFRLGIAFFNNAFEMIIADDRECVVCFHDLEMTIRNGFRVDTNLPSSAGVVTNFGDTYRRMLENCYLLIDFERFVNSDEDVRNLEAFLRARHKEYCEGRLPKAVHLGEMEEYLKDNVFVNELHGR